MKTIVRTGVLMVAAALVVLVIGFQAASAQAPGPVTGNAIKGEVLYYEHLCYGCHGYDGQGRQPLVGSGMINSETGFVGFLRLRADQNPILPRTAMPNYSESSLSDEQAKDILAFIRTLESNTPELEDIPTLNTIIEAASRPYER